MSRGKRPEKADLPAIIAAPEHLSDRAKALWTAVIGHRVRSPGRVVLLQAALEALDRADAAAAVVNKEGMTTTTKTTKAVHIHPLVKAEREFRQQFMRAWEMLGLTWDAMVDGRVLVARTD
jgi:P27 family predicted phage terminase small subunit